MAIAKKSIADSFVHLHLHTEYSLLDGGNRIDRLIDHIQNLGMTSVAITDHGNLHGAIEFYEKSTKSGIKPILGIEAYVAPDDRKNKTKRRAQTGIPDGGFHLVLLAENNVGWSNLLKLSSDAFLEGFYYKPRMDKSILEKHSEGLIAINGHLGSSLAWHLQRYESEKDEKRWQDALKEAVWHQKIFKNNKKNDPCFFVEIQRNGVEEQNKINPLLTKLAKEIGAPVVCDNDAHFLTSKDWNAHDTLCCISMQKMKEEENRIRYPRDLYVKSSSEMASLFEDIPESIENTIKIANRCNVNLDFSKNHTPLVRARGPGNGPTFEGGSLERWHKSWCSKWILTPFEENSGTSKEIAEKECAKALESLSKAGLIWRYGNKSISHEVTSRLQRELKILCDKKIAAYFLIVWDFVNWARQNQIPCMARGSGVGTMVGYVLGLSNACPVTYGLLFERFTDPDRDEYPDIDIDICQKGRSRVIEYVRKKYGHVAQIITFGRLKARAAIKDVSRVHGLRPEEGQNLANLIPDELNITIEESLQREKSLQNLYQTNDKIKTILEEATSLEDHARHAGIHAAGVVIATQPLDKLIPLCRVSGGEDAITQWDGPTCEKMGLLKMDFLGLRTLSTIDLAKKIIKNTLSEEMIWEAMGRDKNKDPHPLDFERLNIKDQKVLDLFRRGDTAGVFQFESIGFQRTLREMQPDRLEDLIAANALFRPGPMELIPEYCERKNGNQSVPQVHDIVDKFTNETYGIMVYQEQVMQIVHELGDIPLREAYGLIKAISKKKADVIESTRIRFIEGALKRDLNKKESNRLFELIKKFAGYGFNKSHSAGYSIVAWQTATLKCFFPLQYMAALLTWESKSKKIEDWSVYLTECERVRFPSHSEKNPRVGISIKPPDVNLSEMHFTVAREKNEPADTNHGHIKFALSAIRNTSESAIKSILKNREEEGPFLSFWNFCERLAGGSVNRSTLEALIKSGAFDSLHEIKFRPNLLASIDRAIKFSEQSRKDRKSGQTSLFGEEEKSNPSPSLENAPPWSSQERLSHEKKFLGIHISGHPLDEHKDLISLYGTSVCSELSSVKQNKAVVVGGFVSSRRIFNIKNGRNSGDKMAVIEIEDKSGQSTVVFFSDQFARCSIHLNHSDLLFIVGRIDHSRGETQIKAERTIPFSNAHSVLCSQIQLDIDAECGDFKEKISAINKTIQQQWGGIQKEGFQGCWLNMKLNYKNKKSVDLQLKQKVPISESFIKKITALGVKNIAPQGIPAELLLKTKNAKKARWN